MGILKRVLEEVEKVMQEFKGMLYRSMEDPNIDLTNVRKILHNSLVSCHLAITFDNIIKLMLIEDLLLVSCSV